MRTIRPWMLGLGLSAVISTACGGSSDGKATASGDGKAADDGKASADGKPADDDGKAAEGDGAAEADAAEGGTAPAAAGDTAAGDGGAGGSGSGGAAAGQGSGGGTGGPAAAETGKAEGSGDGAAADDAGGEGPGGAAVDTTALLKEVKSKKTKDERALEALAEAEAAGATPRDLAKAANARGVALYATPERATPFFEWALAKDEKYPDAAFNLAKQAVVIGEVADTVKWLTETKKRGGKKLVKQVEFDPMWEIVKDDPDVRALIR